MLNKRHQTFATPMNDTALGSDVQDALRVLRRLCQYLNQFDTHTSRISEVFSLTMQIERELANLPTNVFLTNSDKTEALGIFRRISKGPLYKIVKARLI